MPTASRKAALFVFNGDSVNTDRQKQDSYENVNASLGLGRNTWNLELFVTNLTDERAQLTNESGYFEFGAATVRDGRAHTQTTYINRPREYGLRIIKRWGG